MSRIGKIPVVVPKEAKIAIEGQTIKVEGPKGKLSLPVPAFIKVEQKDGQLLVTRQSDTKQARSDHGTTRALLVSFIEGVTQGHKKDLEIQGVGFRAQVSGNKLTLNVGLSHQIEYVVPKEIKITVPAPTEIKLEGVDKALLGEVAAKIRDFKTPEPYKGKGIRYSGEYVRRKQGKAVTK